MISSLQLLVLLSLSFTKANDCNIFSSEFRSEGIADRCIKIHKAVRKAFWSNEINNYTLDEAFKTSSHHRPPTAVIVHYEVQIKPAIGQEYKLVISDKDPERNDHIACEGKGNCTLNVGWSSANVYTFIRPEFVLSLQPAWFLNSLKFSIHEHFGFMKEITFYINLQKHDLPTNTTTHELKHSLEHITAKIEINNVDSTYVWTPLSKTDGPTTFIEIIYTVIVLVLMLVSIIFFFFLLIFVLLPYTKLQLDDLHERCPSVWIGLVLLWSVNIGLEIYHIVEIEDRGLYHTMRIAMLVVQSAIDILCMSIAFAYKNRRGQKPLSEAAYYAVIITFGWVLLRQLISLLFFTAVFLVEIISTVGIVAFGIIIVFMWAHFSKHLFEAGQSDNAKFNIVTKCLIYILILFVYLSIDVITYFVIILYITFLNSFQKSPGSLFRIIFSFFPPILAAVFTHALKRWTKKEEGTQDNKNSRNKGYETIEDA